MNETQLCCSVLVCLLLLVYVLVINFSPNCFVCSTFLSLFKVLMPVLLLRWLRRDI